MLCLALQQAYTVDYEAHAHRKHSPSYNSWLVQLRQVTEDAILVVSLTALALKISRNDARRFDALVKIEQQMEITLDLVHELGKGVKQLLEEQVSKTLSQKNRDRRTPSTTLKSAKSTCEISLPMNPVPDFLRFSSKQEKNLGTRDSRKAFERWRAASF